MIPVPRADNVMHKYYHDDSRRDSRRDSRAPCVAIVIAVPSALRRCESFGPGLTFELLS